MHMATNDLLREAGDPSTTAARLQELAQLDQKTWPVIAANPSAYDGLLSWLGEHGDDSVKAAIAARSATPAAAAPPVPPVPTAAPVASGAYPPGYSAPSGSRNTGLIIAIVAIALALIAGLVIWLVLAFGGNDASTPNPDPNGGPAPTEPTNPITPPAGGDICATFQQVAVQWGMQNQNFQSNDEDPTAAFRALADLYRQFAAATSGQLQSDLQTVAGAMDAMASGNYAALGDDAVRDAGDRVGEALSECDGLGGFGGFGG